MTPKGYILWEAVFDPSDSITGAATVNTGEVYFVGIRNAENPVLYKYSASGYRQWVNEYESFSAIENISDIVCYGDRIFISGNTVLQSFIQTFNSAGNLISIKPLPRNLVIKDITTDKNGNLLIELLTKDILVIKNSGVNL